MTMTGSTSSMCVAADGVRAEKTPRERAAGWKRTASVALILCAPSLTTACVHSETAPPAAPGATTAVPSTPASAAAAAPAAASAGPLAPAPAASEAAATAAAPYDEEDATSDLVEHHRHHHHGGITRFVVMSIDTLGVSSEQEAAVGKVQTDLRAKLEPARAADQAFMALLADGIAAGKIDKAKVDQAIAKLAAASTKAQVASEDALRQLHGILTPPERAALVDKIDAHWHVWEEANETAEASEPAHESDRLEHLTKDLSLTPEQVEKIKATVHAPAGGPNLKYDRKEVQARVEAFGAAFSGETFDAKALHAKGTDAVDGHIAGGGAARMAHFFEAITPVLTPEQRTKLADTVREHANEKGAESASLEEGKPR